MLFLRLFITKLCYLVCIFSAVNIKAAEIENSTYLKQLPNDYVIGQDLAPNLIIEYSSYSCPHCASFHNDIFPRIYKNYIETGQLKWITRLLANDASSYNGTMITECSGNKHYYHYIKMLFNKQNAWAFSKNSLEVLQNIAMLSGMNPDDFKKCLDNKSIQDKIMNIRIAAKKQLNINATPTFYLNGEKISVYSYEDFEKRLKNK